MSNYQSKTQTLLYTLLAFVSLSVVAGELPSIQQRVDAFNRQSETNKDAPKLTREEIELMQTSAEKTAASLPDPGLRAGQKAPDFTLADAFGNKVSLYDALKEGPVVLIFYRGAWCPYCNIQLHALHESLPEFQKYNARLIAVTPQLPDKSLEQVKKDKYPFSILSDLEYKVARQYRLYFEVPLELHDFYKKKFGLDLEAYNGKGRLGLPVPGSFVIDQDGIVVAAYAEHDYKKRMEPTAIVSALKKISGR